MTNDLKPCPFCGSKDVGVYEDIYGNYANILKCVLCRTCNCRTSARRNENEVVEAWNRRAEDEKE